MKSSGLHFRSDDVHGNLLPLLIGRVFHVTCLAVAEQILAVGEIRANVSGDVPSPFGSTNSFFRQRGCVSLFDYRGASQQQIEESIAKCSPYYIPGCDNALAFFFLSAAAQAALIPWTLWKEQEAWSQKIVPFVEAGHPGAIALTSIEELIRVTIEVEPDPLVEALHRGRAANARRSRPG